MARVMYTILINTIVLFIITLLVRIPIKSTYQLNKNLATLDKTQILEG